LPVFFTWNKTEYNEKTNKRKEKKRRKTERNLRHNMKKYIIKNCRNV